MIKRATFYAYPVMSEREEWQRWLKHHTIDPNHVLVYGGNLSGFIEINTALCRVRFLTVDDNGLYRDAMVQLEAAPSDFPERCQNSFYTSIEVLL
jgi:hypothetical protein